MVINIEQADANDVDGIFRLICAVHAQSPYDVLIPLEQQDRFRHAFSEGSVFERQFKQRLRRCIAAEHGYVYVVRMDNRIIGYRKAEVRDHDMWLGGLFVLKDYRGRGIGRRLFIEPLRSVPVGHTVHLTVLENNAVAIKLYESVGFRTEGVLPSTFYGARQITMTWTKTDNTLVEGYAGDDMRGGVR